MGREVRRVPENWEHPKDDKGEYIPMYGDYVSDKEEFMGMLETEGLQQTLEYFGRAPNMDDYMPVWTDEEKTHFMMYETCSEGTPISPAFERPEELARWLADNKASSFGSMTATYDQWLKTIERGWAMSAFADKRGLHSGVEM